VIAQDLLPVKDADRGGRGEHHERAADMLVRHGVIIEVKADIGCFTHLHGHTLFGWIGIPRQTEEQLALLGEDLADGADAILRTPPIGGDPLHPGQRLSVEIVDVCKGPGSEEAIADVANRALDAPLLVAPRGRDGARLVVIMGRQLEQGGMEADGIASALEHSALEVVVQEHARDPTEELEGFYMPPEKARHRRAQVETQEYLARIRQHHHEAEEPPLRPSDADLPEEPPVNLGLLAGQRAQAQIGFGSRPRTIARYDRPEVVTLAGVAPCLDHLEKSTGPQARILLERLLEEGDVRVSYRRTERHTPGGEPGLGEHPSDGAVVVAELGCDGTDAPLLGVEQAQDLRFSVTPDHDAAPFDFAVETAIPVGTRGASLRLSPFASRPLGAFCLRLSSR